MEHCIYIVTGVAGHLGSSVTQRLNEQEKIVYALCLPDEKHPPQGGFVTVFYGDVCNVDGLTELFERCDGKLVTVIHCAGIVSIAAKFNQKVYDVNVTGTKNMIALCEKYRVQKLIYVSSVHAITELPGNEAITEINRFSADDVVGLYLLSFRCHQTRR